MIELLVVLALIIVIAVAVIFNLGSFNTKQNLELAVNSLVAVIRDVQQRSVTQQDGQKWGLRFYNTNSDRYEVFKGASYDAGTLDKLYTFRQGIKFGEPAASSSFDVVFDALTGKIANNKIVSLITNKNDGLVGDIIINSTGLVISRIEPDIIGYWHLDEGTSTIAYDSTGKGNNANLIAGPIWQSGNNCRAGGCLNFNGTTNYVRGPASDSFMGNNVQAITISAWIKTTSTVAQYALSIKRNSAESSLISLTSNQNSSGSTSVGYLGFLTRNYADLAHSWLVYDGDYNDGQWHHVAMTVNGMSRILYIDGVQRGSDNDQGIQSVSGNTGYVTIGSIGSSLFFKGFIDEVRVYNQVLTAAEISNIYNDLK